MTGLQKCFPSNNFCGHENEINRIVTNYMNNYQNSKAFYVIEMNQAVNHNGFTDVYFDVFHLYESNEHHFADKVQWASSNIFQSLGANVNMRVYGEWKNHTNCEGCYKYSIQECLMPCICLPANVWNSKQEYQKICGIAKPTNNEGYNCNKDNNYTNSHCKVQSVNGGQCHQCTKPSGGNFLLAPVINFFADDFVNFFEDDFVNFFEDDFAGFFEDDVGGFFEDDIGGFFEHDFAGFFEDDFVDFFEDDVGGFFEDDVGGFFEDDFTDFFEDDVGGFFEDDIGGFFEDDVGGFFEDDVGAFFEDDVGGFFENDFVGFFEDDFANFFAEDVGGFFEDVGQGIGDFFGGIFGR